MSEDIETDPADWILTTHAYERFIERFGGTGREAVRQVIAQAPVEGWRFAGWAHRTGAGYMVHDAAFPAVMFVIHFKRPSVHVLVTVVYQDDPRDRPARVPNSGGVKNRRHGRNGRTSREKYLKMKEKDP